MSFDALARAGLDRRRAAALMRKTVEVARAAARRHGGRRLVAASVGPYGATLCDGSEYRGDYSIDAARLAEFHRPRLEVLRDSDADLLACETIPSLTEARVLRDLLRERDGLRAWFSFSCRDGQRLADGQPIARAAKMLGNDESVVALGVNCTAPEHVSRLIDEIRGACEKPIVVYPNSGERWDPRSRDWIEKQPDDSLLRLAPQWAARGVWALGGCCRVGPETIRQLVRARPGWR
jgi:homocysteine S-methyltransferase